ncbi:MAG: hypothetical protein AB7I41_01370 [Candidatus Sericytochromatia bacterium]
MSYLMVPKMAFLFHIPEMYFHYRNVLNLLDPASFDIILPDEAPDALLDIVAANEYRFSYISELLHAKTLYRYLISDHVFLHDYNLMNRLGTRQIRFISELGCDRLNLTNWNKLYDMIFCFGRYQERKLKFCKGIWIFQTGWPQFDPFFQDVDIDLEGLQRKYNCDPNKPTLLWTPYFEALCSIEIYAERMAALTDRYNVIVKPHDYTHFEEYERVKLLEQLPFTSVTKRPTDLLELLVLADTVFADYGSTPFPPLYCDKRQILLHVPYAPEHEYVGFGSSDLTLRSYLPTLQPDAPLDAFYELLESEEPWLRYEQKQNTLKDRFFAATYGSSSQVTAKLLTTLDKYI